MTTIRVVPAELREVAELIEECTRAIDARVSDTEAIINAMWGNEQLRGHMGTHLFTTFNRTKEQMFQWDDFLRHFAHQIFDAADAFEQADTENNGSAPNKAAPKAAPKVEDGMYVIKKGDTLWDIGQRYGVTVDELMAANPHITDRDLIYPGQEIVIPGHTAVEPTPKQTPVPTPKPSVPGTAPTGAPGGWYYGDGVNPQHPAIKGAARPPSVDANGYGMWEHYDNSKGGQLVRMIDDPNAPWMTGANNSPERMEEIVRYLNPGGPNDPNAPDSGRYQGPAAGTCNGFAKDAMHMMGAPFPYHAAANEGWQANHGVGGQHQWLNQHSQPLPENPTTGWYQVSPQQAQAYANQGYPGIQISENVGHVAVVIPEPGASQGGNPPYVAEGGAHSTLSNGAYRHNRGVYDHYVYIY